MQPIRLHVVIPFHQPLSATDDVLEQAFVRCYEPLFAGLEKRSELRLTVAFGGHVLDFLSRAQHPFMMRVKQLVRRGQLEVLGGLFYGGVPALLPDGDIRGQVQMATEYWESFVGQPPTGLWLPELAWTGEVPRLLAQTGVEYGFVSASQVGLDARHARGLGVVERGGYRLPAFVLHDGLSAALPQRPVDEWLQALRDQASADPHAALTVWVRAEDLGLAPGTHAWCHEQGWLERWLDALASSEKGVTTALPQASFALDRPARQLRLLPRCAPIVEAYGADNLPVEWTDFALAFPEAEVLVRRMLRTSEKLQEAVVTMEEEGHEEWSSDLATAQRLIFAAQSPDAYWRGRQPGFSAPEIRDATLARLAQAESLIDGLIQGSDDWIAAEEEDLDGDLVDEVIVSNRHLVAWVVPARGGQLRTLDDRADERNVLDVTGRRLEPFFGRMTEAPKADANRRTPRRHDEPLPKLDSDLPMDVDGVERAGTREWVLPVKTTPAEFFRGKAVDLMPQHPRWDENASSIDETGDLTYRLDVAAELELASADDRRLRVHKQITIPIDRGEVELGYHLELEGVGACLAGVELPLRLGTEASRLFVNGKAAKAECASHANVERVRVESPNGAAVELAFEAAVELWTDVVATSVRDVAGYRRAEQGLVLMPVIRVEPGSDAELGLRLSLHPAAGVDEAAGDHADESTQENETEAE